MLSRENREELGDGRIGALAAATPNYGNENPIWVLTHEDCVADQVKQSHATVQKIIAASSNLLKSRSVAFLPIAIRVRILAAARLPFEEVHRCFPMHRLSPELELLRHVVERLRSQGIVFHSDRQTEVEETTAINALVTELRHFASTSQFISERKNYRRKSAKNHRGLLLELQRISQGCSRVLAIRVDFSYRKPAEWPQDTRAPVSFSQVKEHRRLLLKWIKRTYAVVGYAWRLEYGLLKGYHYHFLLLLEGSKHQQDMNIGKHMGERWAREITNGSGLSWNCNAAKYLRRGVGMLDHRDTERIRHFVELVVPYLTKPDVALEFTPQDGSRTFGRSATKPVAARRAGRPRDP